MNVMFDTNIFDKIAKEEIDISYLLNKIQIYATHIQRDELSSTPEKYKTFQGESHRQKLLEL